MLEDQDGADNVVLLPQASDRAKFTEREVISGVAQ